MGKILQTASFLLLLACVVAGCKIRSATENLAGSYPVQPGGKLVVRINQGAIDLQTTDTSVATIAVSRQVSSLRGDPKEELAREKIAITTEGNELRITCKRDASSLPHIQFGDVIDKYVIQIPRRFSVDIESGVGGIRVGQIQGRVAITTAGDGIAVDRVEGSADLKCSGGDIQAREITGPLNVKNAGGDINIGSALGGIEAKSSGGDIALAYVRKGAILKTAGGDIDIASAQDQIEASTAGGDINVTLKESPNANCELKTAGGDLQLTLPASASAVIDAKTSAGEVSTDFPLTVQGKLESSQLEGKIGQGGFTIRLRTSGGDISILQKK